MKGRMDKLRKHTLNEMIFRIGEEEVFVTKPKVGAKVALLKQISGLNEKDKDAGEKAVEIYTNHLFELFSEELKKDEDYDEDVLRSFIDDNNLLLIKQLLLLYKITSEEDIKKKQAEKN